MKIKILSLALLGLLSFTSCSNDDINDDVQNQPLNINKKNKIANSLTSKSVLSDVVTSEAVKKNLGMNEFVIVSKYAPELPLVSLILQNDCNLVAYAHSSTLGKTRIWATDTMRPIGSNPILTSQTDGNLVLYQNSIGEYSNPLWASNTYQPGTNTQDVHFKLRRHNITYSDLSVAIYVKFSVWRGDVLLKEIFSIDVTSYNN
ncbi:hypothetical protein [Chryseobacterium wanjuense]